jgi:hypothetical protein
MYSSHFWLLRSGEGGMDPCLGARGLWPFPGALPESDEARGETLLWLVVVEAAGPGRILVSFRSLFLGLGLGLLALASKAGDIYNTGWRSRVTGRTGVVWQLMIAPQV